MTKNTNIKSATVTISYEALEEILLSHLYAIGAIADNEFVALFDLPIELNDEGLIDIDLDLVEMGNYPPTDSPEDFDVVGSA